METPYQKKFKDTLAEIFEMDHAELDFGIYRIMNQKRSDIEDFLNRRLIPMVTQTLRDNLGDETERLKAELAERRKAILEQGMDPSLSPVVKALEEKIANSADVTALENEVFNHLTRFFSRYYEGGDFISKRRYKDDTYAIPYSGEEVKLYWANADQYYIKTSEYFKNYTFALPSGKKVHFVLRDAQTEQNNNKAANNMERRFRLCTENIVNVEDGELSIFFTYELMPKATKQDKLIAEAEAALTAPGVLPEDFDELLAPAPTKKGTRRTLLMKHLQDYTAKNSFDYFIHKDLGGFLRRELDFYIKNEVMQLDDLDAQHILQHLAEVKAIKSVGERIILFLAQLENFQKRLWLKKKFVVQSDYCITLDRIPETFYSEIAANDRQREEWVRLFAVDDIHSDITTEGYREPLTEEFLRQNPFLVLDTQFFSADFKKRLLASFDNIDEECNGLLINSENFQALELLQEKYKDAVKCTYIDPPYNAKSSEILYKNTFKHASWMSLMFDRIRLGKMLNKEDFVEAIAIDEVEQEKLGYIISDIYPNNKKVCLSIVHNPRGQQGKNISYIHEYVFMIYPDDQHKFLSDVKRDEIDSRNLRDSGTESDRTDAATCFYPILVKNNEIVGFGDVPNDDFHPSSSNIVLEDGTIQVWPIDQHGNEKKWRYGHDTVPAIKEKLYPKMTSAIQIIFNQDMGVMKSLWTGAQYDASEYGTKVLQSLLTVDGAKKFSYPKSLNTVTECLKIAGNNDKKTLCLDFFAGSGTTAHAVINLNREDGGMRKYILCEMGEYFSTVTKPRVQKAIYSEDWRDGKPVSRKGVSQMFKYIRLEQYEDTLNNLILKQQQQTLPSGDAEESYVLGYWLDTETKGSLFNIEWFRHPFDMKLKTTRDNEIMETNVDMVDTFNYLIGLRVETLRHPKEGLCVVEGFTHREGEHTLVVWRDMDKVSNEQLNDFFRRSDYNTRDTEFDRIYVNGDNLLSNIKTDEEHWKVVLIEEEFKKRMFTD